MFDNVTAKWTFSVQLEVALIKTKSTTIAFSSSLSFLLLFLLPFLSLLWFSELLGLTKRAFWRLLSQMATNFVRLSFQKNLLVITIYTTAAVRFQKDALDMLYGPIADQNLPAPLDAAKTYIWHERTDFGGWLHVWKMNASKGENGDIFYFGAKTGNNFANLVQSEMLAPGMIKVEFAVELKMTRRQAWSAKWKHCAQCFLLKRKSDRAQNNQ